MMDRVVKIDPSNGQVTVQAGARVSQVGLSHSDPRSQLQMVVVVDGVAGAPHGHIFVFGEFHFLRLE